MEQESKNPLLSKTLWSNLIMAVVAIAGVKSPAVKEYFSVENVSMLFMFANFVLRMVTKNKLSFS